MDKTIENLLLNEEEIKNKKIVLKSYPKRLIATLSTKCNSKCIMCEVVRKKWDMPQKTLDEIKQLLPYFQSVNWQGGEVLLLDNFYELFLESLKNKSLKQTIVSNGMLLNDKWIDALTDADIEFTISIDGLNKEIYEKIRYGSKYDVLLKNIRKLNEVRKRKNSKLRLKMHTVIMRSNYKDTDKFINFANEYNFDIVYMMPIWGGQQIDENIYIGNNFDIMSELSDKINIAEKKARDYHIEFFHSIPIIKKDERADNTIINENNKNEQKDVEKNETEVDNIKGNNVKETETESLFCYLPWQQLNIDPGGEVRPGCLCSKPIGNIEKESLLSIWNNEQMQEYRKRIINNPKNWCNNDCINNVIKIDLRKV